jgi:hypothetical protein
MKILWIFVDFMFIMTSLVLILFYSLITVVLICKKKYEIHKNWTRLFIFSYFCRNSTPHFCAVKATGIIKTTNSTEQF